MPEWDEAARERLTESLEAGDFGGPDADAIRALRADRDRLEEDFRGVVRDMDGYIGKLVDAEADRDRLAEELAEERLRVEALQQANADFEEEFVCPECKGYSVSEIVYEDDFGSMKCHDCDYAGEPGEDFPTSREVRDKLDKAETEAKRLRNAIAADVARQRRAEWNRCLDCERDCTQTAGCSVAGEPELARALAPEGGA